MNCIFQGGLTIRPSSLIKYVCDVFAYTDHAFDNICLSNLQERKAAKLVFLAMLRLFILSIELLPMCTLSDMVRSSNIVEFFLKKEKYSFSIDIY